MRKKKNSNQKGFTLVELIIVIAILGVLAALLVPRIMGNVEDAKKNKEISNARTLASEITNYNALATVEGKDLFLDTDLSDHLEIGEFQGLTEGVSATHPELAINDSDDHFPDEAVVHIIIDSNGNAEIDIQ